MPPLSFHDYVSKVLPQKNESKELVVKYTQELCERIEKNHLSFFAEDAEMNKSSFKVQEARKYLKIIESNPASWYQECVHVFVNKENGHVHSPKSTKKKSKFDLLNDNSRMECYNQIQKLNIHFQ
jgi:hypothetical protein